MHIRRIHHITVAVHDASAAGVTFERLLDVPPGDTSDVATFAARAATLRLGDARLELAAPATSGTALHRFLERRGEGFYALGLEVEDLDAAVAELRDAGIRVSDPVAARSGVRSAFVSAAATHGLSIELIELVAGADEPDGVPPVETNERGEPPKVLDLTPDEWSDTD